MIAIKTEIEKMPETCEKCLYFRHRMHPLGGIEYIACELSGIMNTSSWWKEWYYAGDTRPKKCPLMEVEDE